MQWAVPSRLEARYSSTIFSLLEHSFPFFKFVQGRVQLHRRDPICNRVRKLFLDPENNTYIEESVLRTTIMLPVHSTQKEFDVAAEVL